jgi:hypothetical protein
MCSNYLHVSGSPWPPARIRSYLPPPSKRCQVQLPCRRDYGRAPRDAGQPAARAAKPRGPLRPVRAGSQAGRPNGPPDGQIPPIKIVTEAGPPALANGAGGGRPRRKPPGGHRPGTLIKQIIRTIFVADRPHSGTQVRKCLAQDECERGET